MEEKTKILFAEDDFQFGKVLKKQLMEEGFDVTFCVDGEVAWKSFLKSHPDICLLDVEMPKRNGFELARQIRQRNEQIPILFLTAKALDTDRIKGYKTGGDAYIVKPCNITELLLRISVFLKRSRPLLELKHSYQLGALTFDYDAQKIMDSNGKVLSTLTPREAGLLSFFCQRPNKIMQREELLYHVWGKNQFHAGRSMDVIIVKIRKHLEAEPKIKIENVHGIGFKLVVPNSDV